MIKLGSQFPYMKVVEDMDGNVALLLFQNVDCTGKCCIVLVNQTDLPAFTQLMAAVLGLIDTSDKINPSQLGRVLVATIWEDTTVSQGLVARMRETYLQLGERGIEILLSGMTGLNIPLQTLTVFLQGIAGIELEAHSELTQTIRRLDSKLNWWSPKDISIIITVITQIAQQLR